MNNFSLSKINSKIDYYFKGQKVDDLGHLFFFIFASISTLSINLLFVFFTILKGTMSSMFEIMNVQVQFLILAYGSLLLLTFKKSVVQTNTQMMKDKNIIIY